MGKALVPGAATVPEAVPVSNTEMAGWLPGQTVPAGRSALGGQAGGGELLPSLLPAVNLLLVCCIGSARALA